MKLRFSGQVKQFRGTRGINEKTNKTWLVQSCLEGKRGVCFFYTDESPNVLLNCPGRRSIIQKCCKNKSSWKMGGWKMKFLFPSTTRSTGRHSFSYTNHDFVCFNGQPKKNTHTKKKKQTGIPHGKPPVGNSLLSSFWVPQTQGKVNFLSLRVREKKNSSQSMVGCLDDPGKLRING